MINSFELHQFLLLKTILKNLEDILQLSIYNH